MHMRTFLTILILTSGLFLLACGEAEQGDPFTSDEATETDEVAEAVTEAPIDIEEVPIEDDLTEEIQENVLALTTLPEPWPADFAILPYYEIQSNVTLDDGSQVLEASIPEGIEHPSFWDLGYFFRDNIPGWGVSDEDNWDCMLSDFDFNIPLTQGDKHILCEGYLDDANQPRVILTYTAE